MLASFPDGRVSRAEIELMRAILERLGRSLDVKALKRVCKTFVYGDAIPRSALQQVIGARSEASLGDAARMATGG